MVLVFQYGPAPGRGWGGWQGGNQQVGPNRFPMQPAAHFSNGTQNQTRGPVMQVFKK